MSTLHCRGVKCKETAVKYQAVSACDINKCKFNIIKLRSAPRSGTIKRG